MLVGIASKLEYTVTAVRSNISSKLIVVSYYMTYNVILDQCIQFDASRRGKKTLNYSRDKHEGTYRRGEGGGGPDTLPRI